MSKMIECWVCGALHDYCPTCGQTNSWRRVADKIEHYMVHTTIEEFRRGVCSKEEAIERFADKCNVHVDDDLSWMLPHVEKGVREIIGEKGKIAKTAKKSKLFKDE